MEKVLTDICEELHNWFTPNRKHRYDGVFLIENGSIVLPDSVSILSNQYFRIVGSALNDGVYRYPAYGLQDELFTGSIWAMSIPPLVLEIAAEIESAEGDSGSVGGGSFSPYSSESFNGYSYSKATSSDGTPMSVADMAWSKAMKKLNRWRKMP